MSSLEPKTIPPLLRNGFALLPHWLHFAPDDIPNKLLNHPSMPFEGVFRWLVGDFGGEETADGTVADLSFFSDTGLSADGV